jgi:molecular chaperone GrpE
VTEEIREEPTGQPDQTEPAGDQDPATEKEYDEAKEEAVEETASDDAAKYLELAQRTQAELENFRKRATRDIAQAGQRAKANLVRELLPVVDNLERALASAVEGEAAGSARGAAVDLDEQHLAEGVRLVHSELIAVLERNGVEQFDPRGERFDPAEHEALSMRDQDGTEPGLVLDVVEKGYRTNGTILRPARVVVSS